MKKTTLTIVVLSALIGTIQAQENKTIKEESTVKRVITKKGSQVIVKETEDIDKVQGAIIVTGNDEENQFFKEDSTRVNDSKVRVDKVIVDKRNEALVAAEKRRQEEEMRRSIDEARAAAEAQRKKLEELEKKRLQELEENKKRLEKRGKGVGKLKKKENN